MDAAEGLVASGYLRESFGEEFFPRADILHSWKDETVELLHSATLSSGARSISLPGGLIPARAGALSAMRMN
jgi:hypothetical protein